MTEPLTERKPLTDRRFYTCLSSGALGIEVSFPESVRLASEYGFEGVAPEAGYLAALLPDERRRLHQQLAETNLRWGSLRVPVDVDAEDAVYADGMTGLARWSSVAAEAGVDRTHMTLAPGSDMLPRSENFARHVDRLNRVASVLSDHGLELGLEYIGSREVRARSRYAFIHTLPGLLELLRAIDPHVGVVLDSFHWYTAGDSVADILALAPEDVISVEISDGIAGVPRDEQEDLSRALPGTTGVIDVTGFLHALARIGYAGPVRVEPFCKNLVGKSHNEILAATKASLAALLPDRIRQQ